MNHSLLLNNLSYIIRTDGEFVPAMPDDEEFSIRHIRDFVAGPPEVVCLTSDGYTLFHNRDGKLKGLVENRVATSLLMAATGSTDKVVGRVLLAHPRHIPSFWNALKQWNVRLPNDLDHRHAGHGGCS